MATNTELKKENNIKSNSPGPSDARSNQQRPGSASIGARDGVNRIMIKLEKRIADGEYYEAHQLYRTLYFRYVSQQKFNDAIDLLMKGSTLLLEAKQTSSGADLALLLVTTLEKNKIEVTAENIAKVASLHQKLVSCHLERPDFVMCAMRWAKQLTTNNESSVKQQPTSSQAATVNSLNTNAAAKPGSTHVISHTTLHARFAVTYWQERDYTQARYHFVRSDDGEGCASMLIEYHVNQGFPSEVDLFIAQAVFQFLCLRNKVTAQICFNSYTQQHPQVEPGPPFIHPLLNFIWLMLIALDSENPAPFTVLCEQYQPSLQRDSSYHDYIARISEVYYKVGPARSNGGGLFGNLLSSLFNMEEGDGSEDDRSLLEPDDLD